MPKKYRIAVIGHTGRGNYGHGVDTVWRELPECEIVGVADADPAGLAEAVTRLGKPPGFADYRVMLDKVSPDIVAIGPRWLDQHHDMVLAAAERGCHMYMEKPMCRSPQEADAMVAACQQHNVKLALAHQTRYSPKLHVIREMIADGMIGDLLELRGRGKEDARGGGEDLWVLGSHIMNLIQHLAGDARWCFARILEQGRPATAQDVREGNEGIGPLVGDDIQAMWGLDDGVTAYFGTRRRADGGRFGLKIYGTRGIIEIVTGYLPAAHYLPDPNWSAGRSKTAWVPISSQGPGKEEVLPDGGLHAGNVLACRDLIAAIEEDRQPECNVFEGRSTVEMITSVFASHWQGKPVSMPLENRGNPLLESRE